jgi:hypothetical protein
MCGSRGASLGKGNEGLRLRPDGPGVGCPKERLVLLGALGTRRAQFCRPTARRPIQGGAAKHAFAAAEHRGSAPGQTDVQETLVRPPVKVERGVDLRSDDASAEPRDGPPRAATPSRAAGGCGGLSLRRRCSTWPPMELRSDARRARLRVACAGSFAAEAGVARRARRRLTSVASARTATSSLRRRAAAPAPGARARRRTPSRRRVARAPPRTTA